MPKPRYKLDSDTIQLLLEALQQKTKIKLQSYVDAVKISNLINDVGLQISPHTISRLAGFFTSNTKPYLYNINTIAHFLGFRDVYDFEQHGKCNHKEYWQHSINESEALLAFESDDPYLFVRLFAQLIPMSQTHRRLLHLVAIELRNKSKKGLRILKEIEKMADARYLYHQFFIDEDNNNNYFIESIERIVQEQKLSDVERVFYLEFSTNKYYESRSWGCIPKRTWRKRFEANIKPEHRESPHLMSRLFVNFIYDLNAKGKWSQKCALKYLEIGLDFIVQIDYFPARLAWIGRLVKCFLFVQSEEALVENQRLKKEVLMAIKSEVEDFEFQPLLQYAALRFQWINENELRSYRSNWLNAVIYSSAWDFLTVAYTSKQNIKKCKEYFIKSKSIAKQVNSKLMYQMIELHQDDCLTF
jgi:hypothetical protein